MASGGPESMSCPQPTEAVVTPSLVRRRWGQAWGQWARTLRGRICLALLLMAVVASVAFWSPRRGLLAVKLAGARIELIHPLEHRLLARSLPFGWSPPVRQFLGRNNQRLNWLGTDDDVALVGLGDYSTSPFLLSQLRHFPNARTLILQGSPSSLLPAAVKGGCLERIFINAEDRPVNLDGIHSIGTLQELKLHNVTTLEMSDQTLSTLNGLHRLDLYASDLSPDVFRQLARIQSFAGTLAFHRCSGIDVDAIAELQRLPRLVRLEIDYCPQIGAAEITALKGISHLRFLELRGTEALRGTIDLKSTLPDCQIDWR